MFEFLFKETDFANKLVNHIYNISIANIVSRLLVIDNTFVDINRMSGFEEYRIKLLELVIQKLQYGDQEETYNARNILVDLISRDEEIDSWKSMMSSIISTAP